MAKVAGILKVAKFAGKVLGGVATAAGIYEGAKIVGNGVTAGLDALRTRNVPPPPSPPTGPSAVAGADELWTGARPELSEDLGGLKLQAYKKRAECEAIKKKIANTKIPFQLAMLAAQLEMCEKELYALNRQIAKIEQGYTSGAEELWTGAAPAYIKPAFDIKSIENEIAVLRAKLADKQKQLAAYKPAVTSPMQAMNVAAEKAKMQREINSLRSQLATKEAQLKASQAAVASKKQSIDLLKQKNEQAAAAKAKEAESSAKLAELSAELEKKAKEAEAASQKAAFEQEKALLQQKADFLQQQAQQYAKAAEAPPADVAEVYESDTIAPDAKGLVASLIAALKTVGPQQVANQIEQGEQLAPAEEYGPAPSDDMSAEDLSEYVSGYIGGACCEACASGHACEGDSCPVGQPCDGAEPVLAGDDGMVAPWTIHWASPAAPAWAQGVFAGGPGIPGSVSRDTCSTGSCRLPK